MNKSKIEWCDYTWNPVTGCLHGCKYCYARKIANRFGGQYGKAQKAMPCVAPGKAVYDKVHNVYLHKLELPVIKERLVPYPFGFTPTFHCYRLHEPQKIKKSRNIFVCSMADLFGDWVPYEWIKAVFDACEAAPWHNYLFLTKNPQRLCDLANSGKLPANDNFWYGSTITKPSDLRFPGRFRDNTFISIEPLLEPLDAGIGSFGRAKWIIIGAETGNHSGKVKPERAWIENIVEAARLTKASVFMKNSLQEIWRGPLIQEYPAQLRRKK